MFFVGLRLRGQETYLVIYRLVAPVWTNMFQIRILKLQITYYIVGYVVLDILMFSLRFNNSYGGCL